MTKTEIALQEKVSEKECKERHDKLEKFIEVKMEGLKELFIEKLKGMAWFNIVHLIGYVSIVITLIAIYMKTK